MGNHQLQDLVESQPLFQLLSMNQKANNLIQSKTDFLTSSAMCFKSGGPSRRLAPIDTQNQHRANQSLKGDKTDRRKVDLPTSPVEFANSIWSPVTANHINEPSPWSRSSFSQGSFGSEKSPISGAFDLEDPQNYQRRHSLQSTTFPEGARCFRVVLSSKNQLLQMQYSGLWTSLEDRLNREIFNGLQRHQQTFLVVSVAGSNSVGGVCQVSRLCDYSTFQVFFVYSKEVSGKMFPSGLIGMKHGKEIDRRYATVIFDVFNSVSNGY